MKVIECPHCGHSHTLTITICPHCGTSLRRTAKHRAIALIEGTAGIGKTTLVDGLMQRHWQLHPHQNTLLRYWLIERTMKNVLYVDFADLR
ncbi:MAG: zinc-ribbon domain-containing protein [Caldilineaceae bacterium]